MQCVQPWRGMSARALEDSFIQSEMRESTVYNRQHHIFHFLILSSIQHRTIQKLDIEVSFFTSFRTCEYFDLFSTWPQLRILYNAARHLGGSSALSRIILRLRKNLAALLPHLRDAVNFRNKADYAGYIWASKLANQLNVVSKDIDQLSECVKAFPEYPEDMFMELLYIFSKKLKV
jgi:hypothetical protein